MIRQAYELAGYAQLVASVQGSLKENEGPCTLQIGSTRHLIFIESAAKSVHPIITPFK